MPSFKIKREKNTETNEKKKKQLVKLIENSDSDDDSDHELSFYVNDRVKLMKQVIKVIKPKKIKSMAPDCMKNLDIEEINSILLEELLGISNKRLKYIFNGQNLEEDSSSTEDEKPAIDIISLDDVSDEEFPTIDLEKDDETSTPSTTTRKSKKHKKLKKESDKEKHKDKKDKKKGKNKGTETASKQKEVPKPQKEIKVPKPKELPAPTKESLMSVLELLELQARARAIKSQLHLEVVNPNPNKENKTNETVEEVVEENDDDVILEIPKNEEILIMSSDSENEGENKVQPDATAVTNGAAGESTWETRAQDKKNSTENTLDTENATETENAVAEKVTESVTDKETENKTDQVHSTENVATSKAAKPSTKKIQLLSAITIPVMSINLAEIPIPKDSHPSENATENTETNTENITNQVVEEKNQTAENENETLEIMDVDDSITSEDNDASNESAQVIDMTITKLNASEKKSVETTDNDKKVELEAGNLSNIAAKTEKKDEKQSQKSRNSSTDKNEERDHDEIVINVDEDELEL